MIMVFQNHPAYVHNIYFESTIFVIYFMKLGRYINHKSKNKTTEAIQELVTITPNKTHKKQDDSYIDITIDEVQKNDILVCLAGERVAVDGIIVKGKSTFDESFITGESLPLEKKVGDSVIAGSINYDNAIEYRADTGSVFINYYVENNSIYSVKSYWKDSKTHYRIAPWDCDHSFGRDGDNEKNMMERMLDVNQNILINRMLKQPKYNKALAKRYWELRKSGIFSYETIERMMRENDPYVRAGLEENLKLWPFDSENYYDAAGYEEEYALILEFVKLSIQHWDNHFQYHD